LSRIVPTEFSITIAATDRPMISSRSAERQRPPTFQPKIPFFDEFRRR
jgi:hypothetical protein